MFLTTTNTIDGYTAQSYCGVVVGTAVLGANVFRDLFAGVRDIVGGRSAAYEKVLDGARQMAMDELWAKAQALGANGVIGIDLDYEAVGSGSMLMVTAAGTAVVLAPAT